MTTIRRTAADLLELRKHLGFTQTAMANQMGLSLRQLQEIENGRAECRIIHILAAERVAMMAAVDKKDPMLAPADLRDEARRLAALMG